MVEHCSLTDKIHIQKYIYLLGLYCTKQIETSSFEELFLQTRREDNYWMSGRFSEEVGKALDAFFLDVDEYAPGSLFDKNDDFNINESELRKRAKGTLENLLEFSNR